MSAWILPCCVNDKKEYYYEVDRAFEKLKTIFWAQSKPITNIEVGDIVYIYESSPVQAIGWKCRVLAVKVPPQNVNIDDSEFEHGDGGVDGSYIKITALGNDLGYYDEESRKKLSLNELRNNGLKSNLQGAERVKPQLLKYISSFKVHKLD